MNSIDLKRDETATGQASARPAKSRAGFTFAACLTFSLASSQFLVSDLCAQSAAAPPPSSTHASAPPAKSDPALKPSASVEMRSLEPAEDEEYTLGGGDEIALDVAGHPELSGKRVIGPDGRVTLASGVVNLKGLTREQASDAVVKMLSQYYRDPSVSINIDKYGSNRIMVTGAVLKPGYVYFDQTPTLLDAITRAGLQQPTAVAVGATATKQTVTMMPQECKVYEGTGDDQKVVTVNLHQLMTSSNGLGDLRLRRDAKIYVENPHDRFVSVLGEVTKPGPVELTDEINLPEVLGLAGGITEKAGNNPTIGVVDPKTSKVRYIKYKDLITPTGMNEIALEPGELVVVPRAGLAKVGYFFSQISPISGIASIASVAAF